MKGWILSSIVALPTAAASLEYTDGAAMAELVSVPTIGEELQPVPEPGKAVELQLPEAAKAEPPAAAAEGVYEFRGTGHINGGGSYPDRWWQRPEGGMHMAGSIPVFGPGVLGEAKVSGLIRVTPDDIYWAANKPTGCGELRGTVELKTQEGEVLGIAPVEGKVCVEGEGKSVKVPFLGQRWIVAVHGTAQVWGKLALKPAAPR